jgi:hypothetical protein
MNSIELLKEYPKAALVVKQWLLNQLLESLKDDSVPEEFKQQIITDGIEDERIAALIDASPRGLFDCFDSQKVYINIMPVCIGMNTENKKVEYLYQINVFESTDYEYTSPFSTRKEVEQEAIKEAFKILNEKL